MGPHYIPIINWIAKKGKGEGGDYGGGEGGGRDQQFPSSSHQGKIKRGERKEGRTWGGERDQLRARGTGGGGERGKESPFLFAEEREKKERGEKGKGKKKNQIGFSPDVRGGGKDDLEEKERERKTFSPFSPISAL